MNTGVVLGMRLRSVVCEALRARRRLVAMETHLLVAVRGRERAHVREEVLCPGDEVEDLPRVDGLRQGKASKACNVRSVYRSPYNS
jgi:hypothetical protein